MNILNPKAAKLLQNLADLDLIKIEESSEDGFVSIVRKLRAKAANKAPSLAEITKEVEVVRSARYANRKPKARR